MSTELPTVSIVIPAYNEELRIRACVIAAHLQTVPAKEIIVVDNRSTDSTVAIVESLQHEFPAAPIILLNQNAVQGIIPTRNLGLSAATGDVVGRIDADSVIEPNWVEEVQKAFVDPQVSGATGPVLYYDMPLRRFGLRADDEVRRFVLRLSRKYHFLFGSNMAIRSSVWRDISEEVCLDAADEMHEDIDLSIHLANHSLTVKYVPTMISGMSARRVEDSPHDFSQYVRRFERTYDHHNLRNPLLRAPMLVLFAVYPGAKLMRMLRQRRLARRGSVSS